MTAFAIVVCLLAFAGQARRVLPEAAFNPSVAGPHAARAMKTARAKPPVLYGLADGDHDPNEEGAENVGAYPAIAPEDAQSIFDTLLDLNGPAVYEMDIPTRKVKFTHFDSMDLFYSVLEEHGLNEMLSDDEAGPFTLYAPTNSAVEKFEADGGEWTKELLMYHIAKGKHNQKLKLIEGTYYQQDKYGVPVTLETDMQDDERIYETVLGLPIRHAKDDLGSDILIGGVPMPASRSAFFGGPMDEAHPYNVECTNGFIQGIEGVLTLPSA